MFYNLFLLNTDYFSIPESCKVNDTELLCPQAFLPFQEVGDRYPFVGRYFFCGNGFIFHIQVVVVICKTYPLYMQPVRPYDGIVFPAVGIVPEVADHKAVSSCAVFGGHPFPKLHITLQGVYLRVSSGSNSLAKAGLLPEAAVPGRKKAGHGQQYLFVSYAQQPFNRIKEAHGLTVPDICFCLVSFYYIVIFVFLLSCYSFYLSVYKRKEEPAFAAGNFPCAKAF